MFQDVNGEPELLRYEVTHWHSAFARLLHYIEHQDDFDATLRRTGITLLDHLSNN